MPPTSSDDFPAPASDTDQNAQLFVVSHTHWDREWYHTAEVFRLSLVDLVDELLDRNSASPFLLDGQAIVLEDYLSTRPGRREQVECALQSGTLEAGPWYVLGDSLIASGESMARNLFEGRRTLRALGAAPPHVLYCPDSFGHAAALPLLATGFGFPVLIAWRGIGEDESSSDTMRWRAKDGSEVLVYHLPRDGYEFGSSLPADDAGAAHRWERIRTQLLARSSLGVALLQNGADHHARQERLDDALASLARAADPTTISRASLADFARALVNRAATSTLPRIVGEQRDSTGYTWSLQGTFASRTPQKRANAKAERLLVRDVEPWLALAFWYGEPSRREESAAVWRTLLASHPHDTLCGCSIDAVAAAMDERLAQVMRAGTELAARARERIVGHDRALARGSSEAWMHSIIVRNAAPFARGGVAQLEVDVPIATVPVGPGSADAKVQESSPGAISIGEPAVALQLLSRERTFVRVESPRDYPRNILVERRRYLAWIHAVGPFSLAGLPVHQARVSHAKPPIAATIDSGDLRNEYLRVAVVDGQVCVETADGRTMMAVIGLEDVGERGDLYTHSPIPKTARQG
ncbi:MAG: hypothetical protein ABIT38_18850, partial [Gemmatimonadaceae bacterium]